jgi:hypothetical protein
MTRLLALALLTGLLVVAHHRFTIQEDEALILRNALRPVSDIAAPFLLGRGAHVHPPLSDVLLHGWLLVAPASPGWLRLPNILFYVVGVALCAAAADAAGLPAAGTSLCWFALLWPYGFHFAWMFGWFSFAFLLVAAITVLHLRFDARPTLLRWLSLVGIAVLLVWTNYYGWIILGLLAVDHLARRPWSVRRLFGASVTLLVVLILFLPLVPALSFAFDSRVDSVRSLATKTAYGAWNLYAMFVSEAIAPWAVGLSVPASIGIATLLVLTVRSRDPLVRRFVLGFGCLFCGLMVLGVLGTKRALFLGPWFLLPLSIAFAQAKGRARTAFIAAATLVASIGWFGTVHRGFYGTLRFYDPWSEIASRAAKEIRDGTVVASYHPSFFYYMTRILAPERLRAGTAQSGLLGARIQYPGLVNAALADPKALPLRGSFILIHSAGFAERQSRAEALEQELAARCRLVDRRGHLRDPRSEEKLRFGEDRGHRPWRIEELVYDCPAP